MLSDSGGKVSSWPAMTVAIRPIHALGNALGHVGKFSRAGALLTI
jgi:hypothetical protein